MLKSILYWCKAKKADVLHFKPAGGGRRALWGYTN